MCCTCTGVYGVCHSRMADAFAVAQVSWSGAGTSGDLARGVRAPLGQPAMVGWGLDSWYLSPCVLDAGRFGFSTEIFEQAFRLVMQDVVDDRYDRSNGMNGHLVAHSATQHPRPYRIEYGVCHETDGRANPLHAVRNARGDQRRASTLVSYPAQSIPPELWSKRHMPVPVFQLVAHVCTRLRQHIPDVERMEEFPNSVTVHWYPSTRTSGNRRGNTRVGYHTDSRSATGSRVCQRKGSPVISISFGETMWFWARDASKEWVVTALEHGSVWVWTARDDTSGVKHSVCYPPETATVMQPPVYVQDPRQEGRWVIIARWLDTLRDYEREYPYRNQSGRDLVWL